MTILVFDGTTLAADKMAESSGYARTVRKIFKLDGHLLGISGDLSRGLELLAWWAASDNGTKLDGFPKTDDEERHSFMWVVKPDGTIMCYEETAFPCVFEDKTFAAGCARDLAIGAMAMGADAVKAVQVAIDNEIHCGNGIDTLTLGGDDERSRKESR